MSKREDLKRAQAGNPHRSDLKRTRYHCPFPNCNRTFTVLPNIPDVCDSHRQFIIDYAFCIQHLTVTPKESEDEGTKLIVPKPGQAKNAIQQALNIAKRGKTS